MTEINLCVWGTVFVGKSPSLPPLHPASSVASCNPFPSSRQTVLLTQDFEQFLQDCQVEGEHMWDLLRSHGDKRPLKPTKILQPLSHQGWVGQALGEGVKSPWPRAQTLAQGDKVDPRRQEEESTQGAGEAGLRGRASRPGPGHEHP